MFGCLLKNNLNMLRVSQSVLGKEESKAVTRIIEQDGYLGMGTETRLFEEDIASYLVVSSEKVCAVNTGTSAIHLVCDYFFEPGDEVLIPSITYVASFQAVSACGAVPVPCDIDIATGLLDLNDAKARITKKTKGIMYVHYASNCGNLKMISDFASFHNLKLIHDAAHSFGSAYNQNLIGSQSGVFCFSFDGIKNVTCGEGGAVVSDNLNLIRYCNDARLLGVEKDTEQRYKGKRSFAFNVSHQGFRYHMSNLNAAIGRVQLQKFILLFRSKRIILRDMYISSLSNLSHVMVLDSFENCQIVPHIMPILLFDIETKNRLIKVFNSNKIQYGIHYLPNHLLNYYKTNYKLTNSENFFERQITLPLHPNMGETEIKKVINLIKSII